MGEFNFERFPKVTRLGVAINDDILEPGPYLLTEKLDGANAGIIYHDKGLILHSRNNFLAFLSFYEGLPDNIGNPFRGFVNWVNERKHKIRSAMSGARTPDHIFGEWLVPHTVRYPSDMYNCFYAFDPMWEGVVPIVPVIGVVDQITLEEGQAQLNKYVESLDRPAEGIVITPVGTDPYRSRYKMVSEQFKEQAGRKWGVKKALAHGDIEEALVSYYGERSYIKITEKVRDMKGQLTLAETPIVLGMAWKDYCEEFFYTAVKKEKYPTVDTRRLMKAFYNRTREIYHTHLETGQVPTWALHANRKDFSDEGNTGSTATE